MQIFKSVSIKSPLGFNPIYVSDCQRTKWIEGSTEFLESGWTSIVWRRQKHTACFISPWQRAKYMKKFCKRVIRKFHNWDLYWKKGNTSQCLEKIGTGNIWNSGGLKNKTNSREQSPADTNSFSFGPAMPRMLWNQK
jgi:hypothetical protein